MYGGFEMGHFFVVVFIFFIIITIIIFYKPLCRGRWNN